ncbi:MAG: ComEC/Rec2 family competence protein [Clostridia bacterium]|nr:ComEC/Rec2 family competence protein [Clostridia bacterium]
MRKIKLLSILIFVIFIINGCSNIINISENIRVNTDNTVHFIDVGQGDSILVASDGEYMLVDAGEEDKGDDVVNYIRSLGISNLKYVVATHPHSDHIGGMDDVINAFEVENIIMPDTVTSTKCFENLLDAVEAKKVNSIEAVFGNSFELGDFKCKILGPVNISDEQNNNSVVIKLNYNNDSILLTGDCSKEEERDIINTGVDISADLLKAGHHGSSTSSTENFIENIKPSSAVISCGKNNDYGHPHKRTMDTFEKNNIKIYRTDTDGTIIADCSGSGITIRTNNGTYDVENVNDDNGNLPSGEKTYILNIKSKKYHKIDCGGARNISDANKNEFTGTIEELKEEGYSPCGICKPE